MEVRQEQLRRICEVLRSDGRIAHAWLFGSHARGDARADSDFDIAVSLTRQYYDEKVNEYTIWAAENLEWWGEDEEGQKEWLEEVMDEERIIVQRELQRKLKEELGEERVDLVVVGYGDLSDDDVAEVLLRSAVSFSTRTRFVQMKVVRLF